MRKKSKAKGTTASVTEVVNITDYTLDDVRGDVSNLSHLLDLIASGLVGNTVDSDEVRFERATALAWVARDLVDTIKQNLDAGGGQPRDLPSPT